MTLISLWKTLPLIASRFLDLPHFHFLHCLTTAVRSCRYILDLVVTDNSILPQLSTSSSLTSLSTVLSHSHSIYVLIIPSHVSYETLLLLILHDPSHFSLFILFHIIISMYFRSSTLLPFVSSILLSSKKSLILVISLALISCWQLKKSGGKHACLLTDSNFNSWPQILPGYSELPDYLYTFIYTCFSCSKIRPYHNFCISSNFQSVVQDAKHPLAPMSSHFPL